MQGFGAKLFLDSIQRQQDGYNIEFYSFWSDFQKL